MLAVNDIITFTNKVGHQIIIVVTRVEDKSWYAGGTRRSYGTLNSWTKYPDFKISKQS